MAVGGGGQWWAGVTVGQGLSGGDRGLALCRAGRQGLPLPNLTARTPQPPWRRAPPATAPRPRRCPAPAASAPSRPGEGGVWAGADSRRVWTAEAGRAGSLAQRPPPPAPRAAPQAPRPAAGRTSCARPRSAAARAPAAATSPSSRAIWPRSADTSPSKRAAAARWRARTSSSCSSASCGRGGAAVGCVDAGRQLQAFPLQSAPALAQLSAAAARFILSRRPRS
jgi:hypothetical protein